MKKIGESSKTGGIAWLLQRISAIILFILLLSHFITYHFISNGKIEYAKIIEKMQQWWFPLIQFLFLITALYHGLNGVWMVIEDYVDSKGWRIFLFSLLITVGVTFLFVGMLTIVNGSFIKLK